MIAAETYFEQWSDFFILVGTGSATLAGLVFVALTINLRGVAKDGTHRFRAINMLAGFTAGPEPESPSRRAVCGVPQDEVDVSACLGESLPSLAMAHLA